MARRRRVRERVAEGSDCVVCLEEERSHVLVSCVPVCVRVLCWDHHSIDEGVPGVDAVAVYLGPATTGGVVQNGQMCVSWTGRLPLVVCVLGPWGT